MAARDILTLNTPMAERIIRLLYTIALILIALGVLMGIARGVAILTHTPMQRPAITQNAAAPSGNTTAQQQGTTAPQANVQNNRRDFRAMRGDRRGWHRGEHRRGFFGMHARSPWFGAVVIVWALVRGLIALLIVRVLAEVGLAILALPKRSTA